MTNEKIVEKRNVNITDRDASHYHVDESRANVGILHHVDRYVGLNEYIRRIVEYLSTRANIYLVFELKTIGQ